MANPTKILLLPTQMVNANCSTKIDKQKCVKYCKVLVRTKPSNEYTLVTPKFCSFFWQKCNIMKLWASNETKKKIIETDRRRNNQNYFM